MGKMIESFHSSSISFLFQIELKSWVISGRIFLPPAKIDNAWIWLVPGDFWFFLFQFSNSHLNLKETRVLTFSNIYYKTYTQIIMQTVLLKIIFCIKFYNLSSKTET